MAHVACRIPLRVLSATDPLIVMGVSKFFSESKRCQKLSLCCGGLRADLNRSGRFPSLLNLAKRKIIHQCSKQSSDASCFVRPYFR
ncbi:hypothetical protein AVEN_264829-1 [Araneus ventricosus]|uniref:Uncharacterized protein n=1 Tax=Araneus ventricosus TaxID=182803 RepID=A0A4Y2E0J0_ARAVE|nr:hypothetical protein AVEN_264829-1 [Araneus ventricosus]